jgi:hypothetical protein
MAEKKKAIPNKPIVSRVPLPASDSALVIDLPDGQKLVIGKMTQGSVIEVATWRGTGRPDSRTSRLMLGMSVNDTNEPASTQTAGYAQVPATPPEKLPPVQQVISVVLSALKSFADVALKSLRKVTPATQFLISKFGKNTASKRRPDAPKQIEDVRPHPVSEDAEIEAWLNKLTEKAAKKTARDMAAASAPKKKVTSKPATKGTTATKKPAKKK